MNEFNDIEKETEVLIKMYEVLIANNEQRLPGFFQIIRDYKTMYEKLIVENGQLIGRVPNKIINLRYDDLIKERKKMINDIEGLIAKYIKENAEMRLFISQHSPAVRTEKDKNHE